MGSTNLFEGQYVTGQGKAHTCCSPHTKVFKCQMFGTFNIKIKGRQILDFAPSITSEKAAYWLVRISKGGSLNYYGWAIRDFTSHQNPQILEVLTKELLPEDFKSGILSVAILKRWDAQSIKLWASKQYWFQSFPFSSVKKADSEYLWKIIDKINWSGFSVLDIGAHYGYFSFKASEKGAHVIGVEPNSSSRNCAITIQENIIHQDVQFIPKDLGGQFDVILHLSVYHQMDPEYKNLENYLNGLRGRTRKHLFVELILPPMFPRKRKMSEKEIDKIVGGKILTRYQHKVRGIRKVYQINV